MAATFKEGEGSDEFRHKCLVRYVITMRMKDRDTAWQFIKKWNDTHKDSRLQADVFKQWDLGNRGTQGEWKDA